MNDIYSNPNEIDDNNTSSDNSQPYDIFSDLKSFSTSFLLNSITVGIIPTPASLLTASPNNMKKLNHNTNSKNLIPIDLLTKTTKVVKPVTINDLKISKFELDLFKDALVESSIRNPQQQQQQQQDVSPETANDDDTQLSLINNETNKIIQFANYEIEAWYKAPYPEDFWQLDKLFICQYCLKYMKSHIILNRHLEKCLWRHPPGREIYRKDELSFFEVDGEYNKIYCQNLCLLAKLFLDHKTLYFDVEPFLFYVLTRYNEELGAFEMIGYFSKEKQSVMNYNLSCILILPPFQNKGYGKLLIDFSYLLSKVEEKLGSPERPLSDLGLISYRNYWKGKLLCHMASFIHDSELSIKDTSLETGILSNDIISTFQYIGLIKYWKGKHVILKNKDLINKYTNQLKNSNIQIDPTCLIWTPYQVKQQIINENGPPALATKSTHSLLSH
jgi:hypothetical protein